jgi:hypothetical protein
MLPLLRNLLDVENVHDLLVSEITRRKRSIRSGFFILPPALHVTEIFGSTAGKLGHAGIKARDMAQRKPTIAIGASWGG